MTYPITVPNRDKVFIAGQWTETTSNDDVDVIDPYTEQRANTVRLANAEDIDRALAAATEVFEMGTWRNKSVEERARAIEELADRIEAKMDEVVALNAVELGTPVSIGRLVNSIPVNHLRTVAKELRALKVREERKRSDGQTSLIVREPVGVIAGIIPWNTPSNQFAFKVGPALAAGNSIVLKTSSKTPLVMYAFADIIGEMTTEGILPEGVFSLLTCNHVDGELLATDPRVDMVSFTGSTDAGRHLGSLGTNNLARVTLELGGKSAAIILDDADLDAVMETLPMSGMLNSGQTCVALTRILVSKTRHDQVVERLETVLSGIPVGDPWDENTVLGPVVGASQQSDIKAAIQAAENAGGTILQPGASVPAKGFFVAPTLITGLTNDSAAAQEEIFGPVITVIAYEDEADAIRLANDNVYGLSGSVYSADVERGIEVASQIRTGAISVNNAVFDPSVPFGGFKDSGVGREGGSEGLEEFFELKTIHLPAS